MSKDGTVDMISGQETKTRTMNEPKGTPTRGQELTLVFTIVAIVIPALTVAIIGTYGFGVWIYQVMAGPPGGL